MALRFNGSSNEYSTALLNYISQQAQEQQKQQNAKQINAQQIALMQKMGLIDGMNPSSPTTPAPTTNPAPSTTGSLIPGAAMSLPDGGIGDVTGKGLNTNVQIPTAPSSPENTQQGKRVSPFIPLPKPGGGFTFLKNPDYVPQNKKDQQSSISSFSEDDIKALKTPKTQEDRQALLDSLPGDLATNVQQAGEYKLNSQTLYGLRNNSGDRAKFDAIVAKAYPGWNAQGYEAKQKYMSNLAAGPLSQNVTSLNTLAHHLGTFENTMKDMQSKGIPAQNAFINAVKGLTGDPTITDFGTAKEVVDNELQKTLTGVGVTQQGLERAGKTIDQNSSYKQMKDYIGLVKGIVKGRIDPLREQYKNNMGEEENGQILYPDSKKYFDSGDQTDSTDSNSGGNDYQSYLKTIGQ